MTLDTEQRRNSTAPAEASGKPPPHIREEHGYSLFQSMDQLRVRHGDAASTGRRMMHGAVALSAGLLLFAALYAVILFLE